MVVEKDWRILKFLFGRLRDETAGSVTPDGGLALRKGRGRYKYCWDAAVRPTWSEETGTKVKEKYLFVFGLANDDVVYCREKGTN